jgi:hypothetical protein
MELKICHVFFDELRSQPDINKPWAGYFKVKLRMTVEYVYYPLSQYSGRSPSFFCSRHHAVGLIVTKFRFLRLTDLCYGLINAGVPHCLRNQVIEKLLYVQAIHMKIG